MMIHLNQLLTLLQETQKALGDIEVDITLTAGPLELSASVMPELRLHIDQPLDANWLELVFPDARVHSSGSGHPQAARAAPAEAKNPSSTAGCGIDSPRA